MQEDQGTLSKPKPAQRAMGQAAPKGASFATGTHTQGQSQTGNIGGHAGAHASIGSGSDGNTQAVSGSTVASGTQSIDNGAQPKQIPAETRTIGQMWGGRIVPALAKHSQTVRLAQRSYNRGLLFQAIQGKSFRVLKIRFKNTIKSKLFGGDLNGS